MGQVSTFAGLLAGLALSMLVACQEGPAGVAAAPEPADAAPAALDAGSAERAGPAVVAEAPAPTFTPDGIAALEARMAGFVTDGHVRGIETLLVHRGEVVSHVTAGIRREATGEALGDDTIYRIYSMTKPVTAVAMLMLVEEGAISLDDPITTVFPELAGLEVLTGPDDGGVYSTEPLSRAPTVRELMSHQAGFAYGLFGADPANTAVREREVLRAADLEAFIAAIADIPLLFQPGERWSYSMAVDIQGAMVERVSGQSFGAFLDSRIFTPLGMDDTGFFVPEADMERLSDVWGYDRETGEFGVAPALWSDFSQAALRMESGGGGLVSTMADYARFCQMLLNGGELDGVRILQPKTVELMRTNVLPDGMTVDVTGTLSEADAATQRFGLGVGVYENTAAFGLPMGEGTFYWGGAAGTWFWIDPQNELFFIGMIQLFDQFAPEPVDFWAISGEHVYGAMAGAEE